MSSKFSEHDLSLRVLKNQPIDKVNEVVHPLQDTWVLWYHDLVSDDWSLKSYQKIYEFNTIEGFWRLYNNLPSIVNSMFFLIKKGHAPIWEAPENINGGSWLFRFPKKMGDCYWHKFSMYLIGGTIADQVDDIIGISLSSKNKNFNVTIAVWNKSTERCRDKVKFNPQYPELIRGDPLYKEFLKPQKVHGLVRPGETDKKNESENEG